VKKLIYRNIRQCLGAFAPPIGIGIDGHFEYSDKDFSGCDEKELNRYADLHEGQGHSLDRNAYLLEVANRRLTDWQRQNGG
jgi:hypothetical protein